ncbi:MAG TPA: hypothetical protein EYP90_15075 [Chromatiaceae bacterium]|nr:hypothetical protein [Chromatiaceae bacterium]
MKSRGVVIIGLLVLIGIAVAAFAASKLAVLNKPGGQQIGTWSGPLEVLAVEADWAKVRMIGWVPKAQVAPAAPNGVRLDGSPGGGIWVSDVRIRKDFFGDARVTGWVTNATGEDFELLALGVVLVDASGAVLDEAPVIVPNIVDGATKGFAENTGVAYDQVAEVVFQFSYGL